MWAQINDLLLGSQLREQLQIGFFGDLSSKITVNVQKLHFAKGKVKLSSLIYFVYFFLHSSVLGSPVGKFVKNTGHGDCRLRFPFNKRLICLAVKCLPLLECNGNQRQSMAMRGY
jgi:hypothetical protein